MNYLVEKGVDVTLIDKYKKNKDNSSISVLLSYFTFRQGKSF